MGPMRPIRCDDATAENGFKAFGDVGDFAKVKSVGLVKLFHHLRVVCVQVLLHPRRVCVHPPFIIIIFYKLLFVKEIYNKCKEKLVIYSKRQEIIYRIKENGDDPRLVLL